MILTSHRSWDKTCAMSASSIPNEDVEKILYHVPPDVLFTFVRLHEGEPEFLENRHPSMIRQAFEFAIRIRATERWFKGAKSALDSLVPCSLDRSQAIEEIKDWIAMLGPDDRDSDRVSTRSNDADARRRMSARAREASEFYRAALLDLVDGNEAIDATNSSLPRSNNR